MQCRHEQIYASSLVFLIVLVLWTVSGETCEDLQCMNSNPCRSSVHADNSTESRCVCGGRWAGRRCQHQIRLKPYAVTSSEARLEVDVVTPRTGDVSVKERSSAMSLVSETEDFTLNYTLVYWKRNDTMTSLALDLSFLTSGEISCVLLHDRKSRQPVLEGLVPTMRYTICVENGFVDSCVLSTFTETSVSKSSSPQWPSNCVTIYTPSVSPAPDVMTKSSTVTVVAVVSVFMLSILVVVFILFLVRRHNLAFKVFIDSACQKCCTCCTCSNNASWEASQDRSCLNHSSSQVSRSLYLEDDLPEDNKPGKRSLLERLKPCQNRPKSSTYTSASMLSSPPCPSSSLSTDDESIESSPLGFDLDDDDSVFDNSMSDEPTALPALRGGRNKPRHRLSRKRRGYVAYSTRKDKNIRLTTVLESPVSNYDDNDFDFNEDFLGCGHSSL